MISSSDLEVSTYLHDLGASKVKSNFLRRIKLEKVRGSEGRNAAVTEEKLQKVVLIVETRRGDGDKR